MSSDTLSSIFLFLLARTSHPSLAGGKNTLLIPPLSSPPLPSPDQVARLHEPHLTAVSTSLRRFGIDPAILLPLHPTSGGSSSSGGGGEEDDSSGEAAAAAAAASSSRGGELRLERTLIGGGGGGSGGGGRVKSICRINGRHASLLTMREVAGPLFARVDVGVASAALGRPSARLAMLDTGVPERRVRDCARRRDAYREARKRREGIERDLESRILPSALRQRGGSDDGFDEGQMTLLQHWVVELGESAKNPRYVCHECSSSRAGVVLTHLPST